MILTMEDRIEIQNLLANYCFTLDDRDWDAFSKLFHPNAFIDFTACGGPKANVNELVDFLKTVGTHVHAWQHTISTNALNIFENFVNSRTAAQVMMVSKLPEGTDHVAFYGLWYRDKIIKESGQWLIKERIQQYAWSYNVLQQ